MKISWKFLLWIFILVNPNFSFAASQKCIVTAQEIETWPHSGQLPIEVSGSRSCDFYKFAWRTFLALTSTDKTNKYKFENFGSAAALFPEAPGAPGKYPGTTAGLTTTQVGKTPQVGQAAALVPVVDHAFGKDKNGNLTGRWVHYSILTNKPEWDFIKDQGFFDAVNFNSAITAYKKDPKSQVIDTPTGSVELKLSWKIMETCDLPDSPKTGCIPEETSDFITVEGDVPQYGPGENYGKTIKNVTLGLVGMHIVHKTAKHPNSIWATFEHKRNAPDCDRINELGPWTFYDPEGSQAHINNFCTLCPVPLSKLSKASILTAIEQAITSSSEFPHNKQASIVEGKNGPSLKCTSNPSAFKSEKTPLFHGAADQPYCSEEAKTKALSTQVCREKSNQIKPMVMQLNAEITEKLPDSVKLASRYQLIGVQWFESPCRNEKTQKIEECGPANAQPDPHAALSNVTIETFEQGVTCVVCHSASANNTMPAQSCERAFAEGLAGRSFIYQRIRQGLTPCVWKADSEN